MALCVSRIMLRIPRLRVQEKLLEHVARKGAGEMLCRETQKYVAMEEIRSWDLM